MKALSKFIFSVVVLGFSIASAQVRPLTAEDLKPGDKVARQQAIASGQFEIVEIPKSTGANSYIRYYTSNGYAEVNAGSAAGNHNSKKKDVKAKLMEIYEATDKKVA